MNGLFVYSLLIMINFLLHQDQPWLNGDWIFKIICYFFIYIFFQLTATTPVQGLSFVTIPKDFSDWLDVLPGPVPSSTGNEFYLVFQSTIYAHQGSSLITLEIFFWITEDCLPLCSSSNYHNISLMSQWLDYLY